MSGAVHLAPERGLDLEAVFSAFALEGEAAVVAAVSGGGDSTVMLVLLSRHLRRVSPETRLVAVTVDHRLRPEAAREAQEVADLARRLGCAHRIVRWNGPKPMAGIPAAARAARYRLLAGAAEQAGARLIVTGHTGDDQAETVGMRLARAGAGAGGRGLAGMAPATLYDGRFWIVRPLLEARREPLRLLLRQAGIAWSDDPANADPRFERARLRLAAPLPLEQERLLAVSRHAARRRIEVAEAAAALIQAHADCPLPGLIRLVPGFLEAPDRAAAVQALRLLLAVAGGRTHPVDALRAGALLDALGRPTRRTLGGAVAERRQAALFLRREERGLHAISLEPASLEPASVFDNRLRLAGTPPGFDGTVVPWAEAGAAPAGHPVATGVPESLARAAWRCQPALRRPDGTVLSLAEAGIAVQPVVAPFAAFLPGFDLAPAAALRRLLGLSPLPASPCRACVEGIAKGVD